MIVLNVVYIVQYRWVDRSNREIVEDHYEIEVVDRYNKHVTHF